MSWTLHVVVAVVTVLSLVRTPAFASPPGEPQTQDQSAARPHGNRGDIFGHDDIEATVLAGQNMSVEQLNPGHYPASRAAAVALHCLNAQHGSPFRWLRVEHVLNATREEVAENGRKYNVTVAVKDVVTDQSAGVCSSEVLFPANEEVPPPNMAPPNHAPPQVHCSCEDLLKANTTEEEQTFYLKLRDNSSLVSAQYLPDSYGNIAEEMRPFWHLGGVASSFVMLKASNESSLYSMAQVANVTQLEAQQGRLMFLYHVLLHELVSQEIIHWKLQVSWSPAEGVRVLSAEWQPNCHHCVIPPTNFTDLTPPPPQHRPNTTQLPPS